MRKIIILSVFAALLSGMGACKKDKTTPAAPYYPTDSLAAYFSFDNNNFNDVLGHSSAGTNHNNAQFVTGVHGTAISLNGTSQYLDFADVPTNSTNGTSMSVWIKTDTTNTTTYFLQSISYGLFTSNGSTGFAVSTPSTSSALGTFHSQQWTHVVGTYDGNNIVLYINGVLTQTINWPSTLATFNSQLTLGNFISSYWGGSIDELFIYHKVLTQAEVNKLYNL